MPGRQPPEVGEERVLLVVAGLTVGPGRSPRLERYWRPVPARGYGRLTLNGWAEALGAEIVRAVAGWDTARGLAREVCRGREQR